MSLFYNNSFIYKVIFLILWKVLDFDLQHKHFNLAHINWTTWWISVEKNKSKNYQNISYPSSVFDVVDTAHFLFGLFRTVFIYILFGFVIVRCSSIIFIVSLKSSSSYFILTTKIKFIRQIYDILNLVFIENTISEYF